MLKIITEYEKSNNIVDQIFEKMTITRGLNAEERQTFLQQDMSVKLELIKD